jgi:TolB-like protein
MTIKKIFKFKWYHYKFILFIITFFYVNNATTLFSEKFNNKVLVYPFQNTGGKDYNWISNGMTDTIISDLVKNKNLIVLVTEDRSKILKEISIGQKGLLDNESIVQIGKLKSANYIFTGTYFVTQKKKIRINVRIIEVNTGIVKEAAKIDGTIETLLQTQDQVVLKLLEESERIESTDKKLVLNKENKNTLKKVDIKNKAYELYSKGLEIHDSSPKEALEYYLDSIKIDPDYWDALNRIGWAYNDLEQFDNALEFHNISIRVLEKRNEAETSNYALLQFR